MTAALRAMGLSAERRFTNDHRVLNRARWSARHGSQMLLGALLMRLVPRGATSVLGADATVERRAGRPRNAKGCYREAVRSTKQPVSRGVGLQWVAMRRLVPGPWSPWVWALPLLTAWCWPAATAKRRRHQTSVDGVRQLMQQVRRWLPRRRLVLVVDGGFAAVSLALAWVTPQVVMVSRVRWEAALSHPPGFQPPGQRGRKPTKGQRQRRLQGWAERADTPWEDVEVGWYGGQRKQRWVFARTALWSTPRVPPVAIRDVLVAKPAGKLRLEAFCCTDLEATPAPILPWVVMRWSVEVTCAEGRAQLGLETQRQWSDQAMARTTPILWALCSRVTILALELSPGGQLPVPVTAWYHTTEPTFAACLALVRRHLWCTPSLVNSAPEPEFVQFPRQAFELVLTGLTLAA